ncbi:serine/threonine protein kinase [Pseudoduganella chitinolytica]|uniref:non-specific serine/threonine protein kinase n=1 Tax=Pseudoduganella chitinolytica TaxID=34070 RepID=A0ABY8BE40_9BURK|nr:serine/threonine-protein kinase [Pseudoduganella chitinolytica]WEF33246.1 serine/threonine-protein kinase [Pseudoduganella chitinolytica]
MAAQNNAPLPDGMALAGYRIVKKIASGGFSIVYLAYDGDGNAVAIKEYLPSSLALRQEGELAPTVSKSNLPVFRIGLKCFFEEGRALARIAHPNVVRVLNFFRANDTVYMVMAYESGQSLQEHIGRQRAKGRPIGETFIRQIFTQVLKGLREVHANQLLHLDLKPANIYLRTDGTPMLLDFGAARQTVNTDVPTLQPMYTPGFAAPELYVRTETLGPWTDIYSIGASMFACMAGAPPQPADQRRNSGDDRMEAHFARLDERYSPQLVQLVRWALQVDPLARPQSVFALQKALQQAMPAPAPAAPPAGGLAGFARRLAARFRRAASAPDTLQS